MTWLGWAAAAVIAAVWGYQFWSRRGVEHVTVHDIKAMLDARQKPFILDVREAHEYRSGHIPGAVNVPLSRLEEGVGPFDRQRQLFLVCASGSRSVVAYNRLKKLGFTNLKNVDGGMRRWPWQTAS